MPPVIVPLMVVGWLGFAPTVATIDAVIVIPFPSVNVIVGVLPEVKVACACPKGAMVPASGWSSALARTILYSPVMFRLKETDPATAGRAARGINPMMRTRPESRILAVSIIVEFKPRQAE